MSSIDLAKRAVACQNWKWKRGMRTTSGILCGGDNWVPFGYDDSDAVVMDKAGEWLPDLADAATLGCLLALVREAWGDDGITTSCTRCGGGTGWAVHRSSPIDGVYALVPILSESEATVLVCALEAAPC